jgi:hypothetical protein
MIAVLARRARTVIALSAAGAALLVAGLTIAGPTRAHADSSYTATGQADGFFMTIRNRAIPAVSAITGGGPTAQATLDSLDQSNAFASFPYPGDEEVGIPGLIGSIFGLPVPGYPAYVSTSYGQPAADKDLPGVNLQASSSHTESRARATAGGNGVSKAESSVVSSLAGDGSVGTLARADVNAFDFAGVLTVSGMRSTATATRDPSGKLRTSSHLSFAQISVPGLSIAVPTSVNACPVKQLPVPGLPAFPCPSAVTDIPLPPGVAGTTITAPDIGFEDGTFTLTLPGAGSQTYPLPAATVLKAFAAAGVTMAYQAPQQLKNGVIAGALVITQHLPGSPVPVPNNPVLGTPGPTDVTYTFGQSSATVDLAAFDTGLGGATIPVGGAPVATGAGTTGGPGETVPSAGSPSGADLGTPPLTGGVSAGTAPPVIAGPAGAATRLSAQRAARTLDSSTIYLVLVGAALLALGGTQLIRVVGVRKLWAS